MLPGFRFLFAATMLSMSLLIFGMGAAALLRAAHESFASNSSWRGAPEVPFAQHPETTIPVLATLRVEPNAAENTSDQPTPAAPSDQPPLSAEPAKNDQLAALRPAETAPAESTRPADLAPRVPTAENPPVAEVPSPPLASTSPGTSATEATPATDERRMTTAAVPDITPVRAAEPTRSEAEKDEPVAAQAGPANPTIATAEVASAPAVAPVDSPAVMKIATLGGPPVDVSDVALLPEPRAVKLPRARPDQAAIKKHAQARRAILRRRLALRARLLLQQQQAYPFAQPQSFAQPQPFAPPAAAH